MDSERFDAIARSFAGAASRRRLLALLAGGLLGPLAGMVGRQAAVAAEPAGCRGFGAFCNRPDQCCSRICHRGQCRRCARPERNCGGVCRNLKEDEQNCGACGNRCPAGATCTAGQCVVPAAACPANSDFCADRSTRCSPVNRGACGCHRTTAGRVACLSEVNFNCARCADDADCVREMGEGARCVDLADCRCRDYATGENTPTACLLPCEDPA